MKMYQVDAFTQQLFKGNPAAVLVLDDWLDDALMQNIALENNLAETAFVKIIDNTHYEIRWFSPLLEIDFCGHATLASAFVLFKDFTSEKRIYFSVKNLGQFDIQQLEDGKISMNFPIRPADKLDSYPQILQDAFDMPFKAVYLNEQAYIVEFEHEQQVRDAKPDLTRLKYLAEQSVEDLGSFRDVVITAQAKSYDCISRYFAPYIGIDEDPVTGSIHTAVVPLWANKLSKTQLTAYQASARGGVLYCQILGNDRIEISGYARLYMQAILDLSA